MQSFARHGLIVALFVVLVSSGAGRAAAEPIAPGDVPVRVDLSVSGSPGDWVLYFAVTNLFQPAANPDMGIYLFGVLLPDANTMVGAPGGWQQSPFIPGTSSLPHNNRWIVPTVNEGASNPLFIQPGETRTGFVAIDHSAVAPSQVPWFAFAFSGFGIPYAGDPGIGTAINPGFVSPDSPTAVTPEPASLLLLGSGLAALGVRRARRKRPNLVL